jgi:fibrillarin-like pre-rRNA processing protein
MKQTNIKGVFTEKNRIFTQNLPSCKGIKVYNERLVTYKNQEFRSWNPYRSKLAAAILKGIEVSINPDNKILYLGAATGTTVSHFSDIVNNGIVYSIESSPIAMTELLKVSEKRSNIIPVLEDAFHPDRYFSLISKVDLIYQDISQRNQAEILTANIKKFLKKNGVSILMVKARSIDVSLKPKQAYRFICNQLETEGYKITQTIDLAPYEKDHAAITLTS